MRLGTQIYGNIPNINSGLEKFDKYEPYMYENMEFNDDGKSIINLPKNSLLLNSTSDIEINDLPNTIEFLYLDNYKVKTPVIKWPENLFAIILSYSYSYNSSDWMFMYNYNSSDWMFIINQLPITLKCICICISDNKISNYAINWPPNLEVVFLSGCNASSETISRLPESIKLLDISIFRVDKTAKYDTYFDNLPTQLEILKIHLWGHTNAKYFTSINNLPDSIQYLSLYWFDYDILKFPSNLQYLELGAANKFAANIVENIKTHKKPEEIVIDIVC
jgi:hypothetical protein